uniref:Uncharacterized protein n=1 Tax=Cyclopterus lumpus TaxID=8103 RepID=A0A8C2ZXV1_CYCLU
MDVTATVLFFFHDFRKCWICAIPTLAPRGCDTTQGGVSFYIILVGVLALVMVCGCATCAFFLSHLHRKRKKQQAVPQEEVSRGYEEIELTLPPSPAPSHPSPALKHPHGPKLDISNREREKLNRFHYTDNQELEELFYVLFHFVFFALSRQRGPVSSFFVCVCVCVCVCLSVSGRVLNVCECERENVYYEYM